MQHNNWTCAKCNHREFETGEFRATGGFLSKWFDVQNKRFTTVSCKHCRYTEIYQADSSTLGNIFDFLSGG